MAAPIAIVPAMKPILFSLFAAGAILANAAIATPKSPALLPLPTDLLSGAVVMLECGRTYTGTLNLTGKSNVTVKTEGGCGKASISPGRPVAGWSRHKDKIQVASVPFAPVQVALAGKPLELAHHPNKPQTWLKGKSNHPYKLQAAMPNPDLAGATLVYRPEEWTIETRQIKDYADGWMTLAAKNGDAIDPKPVTDFYVEGKLWMLDTPGEWAYANGKLYVWSPDGQPLDGRVWASPKASGIDATDSRNVVIDGVRIFSASIGIDGSNSVNLQVLNTTIENSAEDGIFAGGSGLLVNNSEIVNSVRNGILGDYGITGSTVTGTTVRDTGTFGMPKRSKGAIVFEDATGQRIAGNRISNASYIGIRVHRNAVVSKNTIENVCQILSDCGGIYTFARDRQPLHVRIEGNTIRGLLHRAAYGVYLDDFANGVIVTRNTIADTPGGIELHNGFNNMITHNRFSGIGHEHILFNETGDGPSVRHNQIAGNTFVIGKKEAAYRMWSVFGGANVEQFAYFHDNVYAGGGADFAEVAGTGMVSFSRWKSRMKESNAQVKPAVAEQGGKEEKMVRTGMSR
jgi:parallel beta-helix repeat protein